MSRDDLLSMLSRIAARLLSGGRGSEVCEFAKDAAACSASLS